MRSDHTLETIEEQINKLKTARISNADDIKGLEERNEVIIVEIEKLLVRKGELIAQDRMKEYFKDEQ